MHFHCCGTHVKLWYYLEHNKEAINDPTSTDPKFDHIQHHLCQELDELRQVAESLLPTPSKMNQVKGEVHRWVKGLKKATEALMKHHKGQVLGSILSGALGSILRGATFQQDQSTKEEF